MEHENDFNEEVTGLMEDHDLDYEEAEEMRGLIEDEGLDEEEALEIRHLTGINKTNSGISWGSVIFIIILGFWAYNHYTSKTIEEDYGYKVETSGITDEPDCTTLEPDNPYDYDSGHYAGFEWGENGNSCGGNSDSFIEGCEEYQNQEDSYEYCLDRNK